MADINNVGKFGKNSGVDLNSIKGGLKKDALKTEEQKSIFEAVDADKNGVLDDNEVKSFKEKLDTSQDGVISKKEAKKFLKSLNLNEVDQNELLKFLLDYSLNTEDVQEVRIKEENGKKLVEVVYKNGTTEIVNHDKSSVVTSPPDEDGNVTVSHFAPDKKLTKTSVTNAQGDVTDTEYLDDGETPVSSVTTTKSGSVSTVTYEEGKPVAKQVKHGSVTSNYSYAEDGSEVLNSKIENECVPTKERRTEYSYDENGVATANITEFGKTTVQTIVDNNVVSETITEEGKTTVREFNENGTSTETITEEGKTTVKTHNQDGTLTETITTEAGTETTVYNSENKRLSKTKVVDGQEYTIQYDGQGNTVGIIVENGESPALIAKRFGCDVNELLELNKSEVRGKGKGRYFRVAVEIKIPGEIEPDAKVLQGRQTKEEALAGYQVVADEIQAVNDEVAARKDITFTEKKFNTFEKIARNLFKQEGIENPSKRQLDVRIADLKNDNPDLKDGELIGKKIRAGVAQGRFEQVQQADNERKAAEATKQEAAVQKQSAKSIYDDLMKAIDGWNDDDEIYKALRKIDDPTEMAEVERLLQAKGYKADNYYSAVEKFMYKELGDSKAYDTSFDEMEAMVQNWISNGTLTKDKAVKAQARLAARLIIDGCDGLGTDVDETIEGIRLIKAPKPTGNKAADNAEAAKVYAEVNRIIKGHTSFGAGFKDLKDYLEGDLWDSEIKYLDGIMAQNNAIQGEQKATAIHDLVEEAVSGGGTDIEYLKQAIMAINFPEDRAAIEAKLKDYCNKKGIKPQIEGQDYLQAILYDECDTFLGVSTDHNEIRKFNEMLIAQGAYTEEEAQKLRAETAALQMLDGGLEDIQSAAGTIKDAETYAKLDALLKTKNYTGVEGFINKKLSSQVSRDKAMAIFASNNLLSDAKAAKIATRLLQNSDYDTRALGLMSIRNAAIATAVNDALKQKGTSLENVLKVFNEEKAEYKEKAGIWDSVAFVGGFLGLGSLAEHISDEYRENTDMSDNLYLESDNPITFTKEQIAAYEMTVKTLEDGLEQMKADYEAALDSQGVVSGAVNEFCSVYNIGTTRDEIEARIEHEEETVRLLTLASQGKLTKIVNGKTVPVTFEEVFNERQSAIVSANGVSLETVSAVFNKKDVNFDVAKVEKVANKAQTIVAMDFAKDNIAVCWSELEKGLKTNSNKELSIAINDTLQKLSEMSGKEMNLSSYGYEMKNGIIVDKSGKPVPATDLKEIAKQLKVGLSDVSQALLGVKIPANESYDDVVELLEDGYEDKMEAFKQEYRDAFGQEATDEMIENYISTINTGKMVVNIGAAIGAVIAAPFTGGGSLAVFAAAAGASMGLNALEKSTDSDGYTNTEWTSDSEQALWDGALAAVGFKVGAGADKLVTQGFKEGSNLAKIANSLMNKNRALIQKFGPNLSQETVEKATIWLSRAEATFGEVSSDTVQSIVQSYCMEGELNMDSFVSGMIMSVAGNAAGHTFSAFGDSKAIHQKYQKPELTVKESHHQTPTLDSITGGGNKPSGIKLGEAKAKAVNDEIDAMLANPETNEVDLAEVYGKLEHIQNRDVRRQAQAKIMAAVENLSDADKAKFGILNTNRLKGQVDDIMSSGRPLETADVRVINDYIKNETDPVALSQLKEQLNSARSSKQGVTATYEALDVAITKRVGQLDAVVSPKHVESANAAPEQKAEAVFSTMDDIGDDEIPPELKSAWGNCKTKFREAVDLLEDLQPKAAMEKAKELASELTVIGRELTGIAKVKFNALVDKIQNYFKAHNMSEVFDDVKVKAAEFADKVKNSVAYKKTVKSMQNAYAGIKAKDIPTKLKKAWAECGSYFDEITKHLNANNLKKAKDCGVVLLAKLKNLAVQGGHALKLKLTKLLDDLGNWLRKVSADVEASSSVKASSGTDGSAKVDDAKVKYSQDVPRSSHLNMPKASPNQMTKAILESKDKAVQMDFLAGLKNEDGTPRFTPEQIKQIVNENPKAGIVDSSVLYGLFKDVKTPDEFRNALDTLNAISDPSELKFVKEMLGLESVAVKSDGTFSFTGKGTGVDNLTIEQFINIRRDTKLPVEDFDNCLKEFLTNGTFAKALVKKGGNIANVAASLFPYLDNPHQFEAIYNLAKTCSINDSIIAPNWKNLCSVIKSKEDVSILNGLMKQSRFTDSSDFSHLSSLINSWSDIESENLDFARELLKELGNSTFNAYGCRSLAYSFNSFKGRANLQKSLLLKQVKENDFEGVNFVLKYADEINAQSKNPLCRMVYKTGKVPFEADGIAGEIDLGLLPNHSGTYSPIQMKAAEQIIQRFPDGRFEALGFRQIIRNVKSESDLANLSALLEIKNLDTKSLIKALESGITDPKKIMAGVKEASQFSEALAKQLRLDYKLNSSTANNLAKFQAISPKRYQRIVDSGLLDLIRDGKVSESILKDISETTFLSNRTLADARRLASGEPYVPTIPKSEIEAISKHVANGDVCEVDGALFVNHNGKPVRLQISKAKFEELFPPLSRVSFGQGATGDCWLVSTLDNLMDLPAGRVQLYQLLRQEADDIFVTFPGTGKSIKFPKGEAASAGRYLKNSHMAGAPKGLQLIEQAYAVHRVRDAATLYADGEITDIQEILKATDVKALMKRINGGHTTEAMETIMGVDCGSRYSFGSRSEERLLALKRLNSIANRDDVLVSFYTKNVPHLSSRAEITMNSGYDMHGNHAYSLKGYDHETGMVYLTNPWHSQVITEVPVHEFLKYADSYTVVRLDGKKIDFDKFGTLLDDVDSPSVRSQASSVDSAPEAAAPGGVFTDRLKRIFGGGSDNNVKAVMKNVTGPDGTPKYTKAQINELLEKSKVPIPDDVLTEFLNFPVRSEIDFKIKQQVIQQLKSPDDVQVLSSLIKLAKTDGADFNLAQIGDIIDIADFSGKGISNPAEIFDTMHSLFLVDDPYAVPTRFNKYNMLDFISNIRSEAHKEALMTMLNSANTHSQITTIHDALSHMEEESVVRSFNLLAQKYPDKIHYSSTDLFEPYVIGPFNNLSYDTSLANFQKIVLNDLVNQGASLERISEVINSLSFNIYEMSAIADPQGIMTLIKNGESGSVINYIIREGQPVSVVDSPVMKYMRANGYPINQFHFDDITTLLSTDLSTPQQIQAFNDLIASKDLGLQTVEIHNIVSSIKTDADVARLKSMIDSGKVDTFQFIRDTKPAVTPDAPEVKPSTPEVTPETPKAPAQIRLDEIKRLKATYGLDINQTQGLVELKINNPKRFAKIENSGLLDLIRDGKIDAGILSRLDDVENMFFSNRTLSEIRRIANGEPLVPSIPKSEIEAISKHVPNGNVCEIDGALYVNDNGRPVRLKISKDAFENLFPPLGNVAFIQGDIGDCWFVSTLENLMDKPSGRVSVYQLFEQQGDDILVRFPGQQDAVLFNKGLLAYNGRGPAIQSAEGSDFSAMAGTPKGVQMIEQAYAVHRLKEGARAYDVNSSITDINKLTDTSALLKRMNAGTEKEALLDLLGNCDVEITRNKAKITQMIVERANDPDFVLEFGTVEKPGFQVESVLNADYDLYSTHAYAIKGYNPETGMVYISNPWSTHTITEVPMYELTKYLDNMTVVDLRTVQRADASGVRATSGVEKEGILDIFKKKKPVTTTSIVENLPPELRDLRVRLLSSETPTTYDKAHFESWAQENGLELRYTSNGTVAEFFDQGKRVRRITEDSTKPGMIYDDRISYYDGNGELAGGRLTYSLGKPLIYDVVDGNPTNMVTLDAAGNWVSKETGLKVNYNPITGMEAGAHGAVFGGIRNMFGKSKPSIPEGVPTDVPEVISSRAKFQSGFTTETSGIASSVPSVSTKLRKAIDMEAAGKTLVTQLNSNVDPASISRYVKDGEVCAIGNTLYVNDNGAPVQLKLSKEKFEELFPPVGCATAEQAAHHTCWLVSEMNAMMDSSGGRVQLFTMLEQDGNDILVRLKNRELPIRFENGQPLRGYSELQMGENAAPGLDMIYQSVLSERMNAMGGVAQRNVTNIEDFDIIEMTNYSGRMQGTTLGHRALVNGKIQTSQINHPNMLAGEEQIMAALEKFKPGEDIFTVTFGEHHRHVVDYNPKTKMITFHDPYNGGVDRTCPVSDLLNQFHLTAQYYPRNELTAGVADVSSTPVKPAVTKQADVSVRPQVSKTPHFEQRSTDLIGSWRDVATTADGLPIRAKIQGDVVIIEKEGKFTEIPIAKGEEISVHETSTDSYLIIKREGFKITVTTSKTPELDGAVQARPTTVETPAVQAQPVITPSKPQTKVLTSGVESVIGTINGKPLKAKYVSLSADRVATVEVNGKVYNVSAGSSKEVAKGVTLKCDKFGRVSVTNSQGADAPQVKPQERSSFADRFARRQDAPLPQNNGIGSFNPSRQPVSSSRPEVQATTEQPKTQTPSQNNGIGSFSSFSATRQVETPVVKPTETHTKPADTPVRSDSKPQSDRIGSFETPRQPVSPSKPEVRTPAEPQELTPSQSQRSGIGSFGDVKPAMDRPAPTRKVTEDEIYEEMHEIVARRRELQDEIDRTYDVKFDAIQTRQSTLDVEFNEFNVQTRAIIEQKRAQMQGLFEQIHDEKRLLEVLERQDRQLEQQFLEYKSALYDLEKKLELFESTHGRDGGTIDELYNYASEQRRRTIGAEFKDNMMEKVIPENVPSYYYDPELAELFHAYNITTGDNKARVVAELREKLAEVTGKYERNTARLTTCREGIESMQAQHSALSKDIVDLGEAQAQRRADYRSEKEALAGEVESTKAAKEQVEADVKNSPKVVKNSERYRELQRQLRGEIPMEEVPDEAAILAQQKEAQRVAEVQKSNQNGIGSFGGLGNTSTFSQRLNISSRFGTVADIQPRRLPTPKTPVPSGYEVQGMMNYKGTECVYAKNSAGVTLVEVRGEWLRVRTL